jgi:glutathione synthase/RimK-type ligase-like ATP-grasp enzyme
VALNELENYSLPWFARKFAHERGKDIFVCKTKADVRERVQWYDHDFFTVYIPHDMELRAWVWKDEVFAVYHKQYRQHSLENYKNMEFRSELRDDLLRTRTLTGGAIDAVKALKMDFGAVDILHGLNGKYYVLEVNSMPDISSTIRVSGIRLADRIHRWAEAQ